MELLKKSIVFATAETSFRKFTLAIIFHEIAFSGCPVGWESFDIKCYKFVVDDKLFFEEADAACWVRQSTNIVPVTLYRYVSWQCF